MLFGDDLVEKHDEFLRAVTEIARATRALGAAVHAGRTKSQVEGRAREQRAGIPERTADLASYVATQWPPAFDGDEPPTPNDLLAVIGAAATR